MNPRVVVFAVLGLLAVVLVAAMGVGLTGERSLDDSTIERWQDRLAGLVSGEPLERADLARVEGCALQGNVLAFSNDPSCRISIRPADVRTRKARLVNRTGLITFDFRPAVSDEPRPTKVQGCLIPPGSDGGRMCPRSLKVFEAYDLTVYEEGGVLRLTCQFTAAPCKAIME